MVGSTPGTGGWEYGVGGGGGAEGGVEERPVGRECTIGVDGGGGATLTGGEFSVVFCWCWACSMA